MVEVTRIISWVSIGLVAVIGVVLVTNVVRMPDPGMSLLFGILIIAYAVLRAVLLIWRPGRRGKKP
jgi:hypothetical protein